MYLNRRRTIGASRLPRSPAIRCPFRVSSPAVPPVPWSRPEPFGAWVRLDDATLVAVTHALAAELGVTGEAQAGPPRPLDGAKRRAIPSELLRPQVHRAAEAAGPPGMGSDRYSEEGA